MFCKKFLPDQLPKIRFKDTRGLALLLLHLLDHHRFRGLGSPQILHLLDGRYHPDAQNDLHPGLHHFR